MPRSERRRWWLERDPYRRTRWVRRLNRDAVWPIGLRCIYFECDGDDAHPFSFDPPQRSEVAIARLAQWQRIRYRRLVDLGASQQVHFTERAQKAEREFERLLLLAEKGAALARDEADDLDAADALILDADAAVLASRCAEEAMRVECEGYRNAELQEQVGDLTWQLAQAVQREEVTRGDDCPKCDGSGRITPEDGTRDQLCDECGGTGECDYPSCGHGAACVGCDYDPQPDRADDDKRRDR